jgi:hypothetical protein
MTHVLSAEQIQGLGFDWPGYALIEEYLVSEGDRMDLAEMIRRMQSSRAFYQKQIDEAYAFKRQTGADYSDFSERFDDFVRMERQLGQCIAYLGEIMAAMANKAPDG